MRGKVGKNSGQNLEAVGWVFWLVTSLILVGPLIYAFWQVTHDSVTRFAPVVMGTITAAIGAGFIAWPVNVAIQRRNKKQRLAQRRKSKKK